MLTQKRATGGYVRGPVASAPGWAVGERQFQLMLDRSSQSISPFALPTFTGFLARMERSDFWADIDRSSLPPPGLPSLCKAQTTDLPRPPRVRTLNVPPPPLRLPPQPRLDFGRHVHGHAHPAETASMEFTLVRCCGLPPASSPHDLAAKAEPSRDRSVYMQLPSAHGCYQLAP